MAKEEVGVGQWPQTRYRVWGHCPTTTSVSPVERHGQSPIYAVLERGRHPRVSGPAASVESRSLGAKGKSNRNPKLEIRLHSTKLDQIVDFRASQSSMPLEEGNKKYIFI